MPNDEIIIVTRKQANGQTDTVELPAVKGESLADTLKRAAKKCACK